MSTKTLQDRLVEIIEALLDARDNADDTAAGCADLADDLAAVCTFEDRGLRIRDAGLVIGREDGRFKKHDRGLLTAGKGA